MIDGTKDRSIFERWQQRLEKGLAGLVEKLAPASSPRGERYARALEKNRALLHLNAPTARLLNSLGEICLRLNFPLLSLVLLRKAGQADPRDPVPQINLSRAQLGIANRFLLRVPRSGAAAFNLRDSRARLGGLLEKKNLPASKEAEIRLLVNRIDDREAMWHDIRAGRLDPSAVRDILMQEERELRAASGTPSIEELEKLAPRRTGFYYREYREEQRRRRESGRGRK